MANIDEVSEFPEDIPLLEENEKVRGGVDGPDNRAPKLLANRTRWLKTRLEFLEENAVAGAVFITDIRPQDPAANVGDKVKTPDGYALLSCSSTSPAVIVSVMALTGHTSYRPTIRINGGSTEVPLTPKADAPLWTGELAVTLDDADADGIVRIQATHDDGAVSEVTMTFDTPPVIFDAIFIGDYPLGQTELKAGDTFSVKVSSDLDVVGYEVEDSGAFVNKVGTFTAGKIKTIDGLVIADRGNVASNQGFRIRVKKASGSWSAWYDSKTLGGVDKLNVVKLNNLRPVITFGTKVYPGAQSALKTGNQATVTHTVTNADSVEYTSTELTVTAPSVFEAAKTVTHKSGTYNVSVDNLTVTAKRVANGATTIGSTVVKISTVAPIMLVTVPAARLRSGGNNGTVVQKHLITLTSNQELSEDPTLNVPEGTWEAAGWEPNDSKTVWTRNLEVHDDNIKGTYIFNSLTATSLSGLVQTEFTGDSSFVLGGFVFRKVSVPAWPNREFSIGTSVADTAKLRCTNLGKGGSGTLNSTFQASLANAVDKFTITGPTGVLNPTGDLWYNLDAGNASSNTGGVLNIELEEVI